MLVEVIMVIVYPLHNYQTVKVFVTCAYVLSFFVLASLLLEVNEGSEWIDVPCIGKLESCHYDDICIGLTKLKFPKSFTENGDPCQCPFDQVCLFCLFSPFT